MIRFAHAALLACLLPVAAAAQVSDGVVRIGFITDLSGPYASIDGPNGAEAIRMAVADAGSMAGGSRVEVLAGDHRNDPAAAAALARTWFKGGLDVLIGGVTSSTSLAMAQVAAEHGKPFLAVGSGNSAHTNEQCAPTLIHYAYDTTAQGRALGGPVVAAGGRTWFMLAQDYPFGQQMHRAATGSVVAAGGRVIGSATHPYGAGSFDALLQQASKSNASVLGLTSGHTDLINTVRAAKRLGVTDAMTLAATFAFIDEIRALGPDAAGMYVADSWFWSRDADTRAWSSRFHQKTGRMPSSLHAADYSAAGFYLQAVQATGSDEPSAVLAHMRGATVNDMYAKGGRVRPDGRMVHDMYVLRVKAPDPAAGPWDLYEPVAVVPGEAAWGTKAETRCPLWR